MKKIFITGCDSKTQWQLKWFVENFQKHNSNAELMIWDFGMNGNPYPQITQKLKSQDQGWFKKPRAMFEASKMSDYVCWLDTDCEVRDNIEDIFDYIEPNKLAMVEDVPWSRRRGEKWHNSGVVGFIDKPVILHEWCKAVQIKKEVGDQEVLHSILNPITKLKYIKDLPNEYNVMRVQVDNDNYSGSKKIMHWTGQKGKVRIRSMINE